MNQTKPLRNLPKTVTVNGVLYPIRWDFRTALKFMEYVDRSEEEDETFLNRVLGIWYPRIPENKDGALTAILKFYCGGELPNEGYYSPLFPPEGKKEVYHKFLNRYGIDLQTEEVHWWVFRRLLEELQGRRPTEWIRKKTGLYQKNSPKNR